MKKVDFILAILSGEGVAWLLYGLIKGSDIQDVYGIKISCLNWILAIFLPILAIIGLWICYLIGKRFLFVFQAGKFLLMGVLATLIDLGVLNLAIWIFNIARGWAFSIFKLISFVFAIIAKYWGNKLWAFEQQKDEQTGKEFSKFLLLTLIGLGINIGVASFVVNVIGPQFGIKPKIWANIGAIIAAIIGSAWNFLTYKFIVFKK